MSEELLIREAKRRAEVFRNIRKYLEIIVKTVKELDKDSEVYLFGSVAEGKYLISSDIDVLVVTNQKPGKVLSLLWNKGIKDPFEIHVVTRDDLEKYKKRSRLVKIKA